jgi:hypothetical protein
MSNETPFDALANAIHEEGKQGGEDSHYMEVNSDQIALSILDYLKNEGGWELVKIIPKSMPFTGIYPPGTK